MTRWLLSWNNSDQDFIRPLGLWYNLNKTRIEKSLRPSLLCNLVERKRKKKGGETEWSARKLIWMGISGAQSPLASLMGAHRTVRARGESRKDGLHPFLWPSLTAVILSSFNPHFPQSLPSSKSPSDCSAFFPASPSLHPAQAKALCSYPTSQRDKLKCVAHTLSLSLSNLLRD